MPSLTPRVWHMYLGRWHTVSSTKTKSEASARSTYEQACHGHVILAGARPDTSCATPAYTTYHTVCDEIGLVGNREPTTAAGYDHRTEWRGR